MSARELLKTPSIQSNGRLILPVPGIFRVLVGRGEN